MKFWTIVALMGVASSEDVQTIIHKKLVKAKAQERIYDAEAKYYKV